MRKSICFLLLAFYFSMTGKAQDTQVLPTDSVTISKDQNNGSSSFGSHGKKTIIRIELDGAFGGSGYVWNDLTKSCSRFSFIRAETKATDSSVIGSPEKRIFYYELKGNKGSIKFNFALQRPWDKTSAPAQTFKHNLKIYKQK